MPDSRPDRAGDGQELAQIADALTLLAVIKAWENDHLDWKQVAPLEGIPERVIARMSSRESTILRDA